MCKVIQFTFDCGHYRKLRKSRCRGMFQKERRGGKKAACCAEAYLAIRLSFNCGQCYENKWERNCKQKLAQAKNFLAHLIEADLPGVFKVSEEIKKLEQANEQDAWKIRQANPHINRVPIKRVESREDPPGKSLLSNEIRPKDVVLLEENQHEFDDDEDCVLSTDPLHPITSNYSFFDDLDTSWTHDILAQEVTLLEGDSNAEAFTDWSGPAPSGTHVKSEWNRQTFSDWAVVDQTSDLTGWSPDVENSSSSGIVGIGGLQTADEEMHDAQVAQILELFWKAIDAEPYDLTFAGQSPGDPLDNLAISGSVEETDTPDQDGNDDLTSPISSHQFSDGGVEKSSSSSLVNIDGRSWKTDTSMVEDVPTPYSSSTVDRVSQHMWMDGPSDCSLSSTETCAKRSSSEAGSANMLRTEPSSSSETTRTETTTSSPSSTTESEGAETCPNRPVPLRLTSSFDKQLHELRKLESSDPDSFYKWWLVIARAEIKAKAASYGVEVPFPMEGKVGK
ncbi:hypothetical protein K504DRAFT_496703 [Pleomassaria siparia CBS 279.74]|uniref:Uncharacterized protein n=1 Tax=Pleomassaria siparia CBS 279.74 TaxID=1314801 RepID=A0A6G1KQX9_9PLEO|nr:hypothetical protein K504DRAFT_496703 [Pleomassaria siparia CBS 279.74]